LNYTPLAHASTAALPLRFEVLPQWLKRLGYNTHMIGKWHLGFNSLEYTPTGRGFDSFFGYYNGDEFYYNHTSAQEGHCGLDFWHNIGNTTQAVTDLNGTYSTYAFTDEAKRIIADHDTKKPLFLYLSYQAVHATCMDCNVEAPEEAVDNFPYIKTYNRSLYAGALHVMDRSIGEVLATLQSRGMLGDSIVVFASDNGAAPLRGVPTANAGSNWPLRGSKSSVWDGGMRTPAVFWYGRLSDRLPRPPLQRIVHIVDWAPTFYAAAGGDVSDLGDVDGQSQWDALSSGEGSERKHVILQIEDGNSAIISGRKNWREELIVECSGDGPSDGDQQVTDNYDPDDTVFVFDVFKDPCELNNLASTEPQGWNDVSFHGSRQIPTPNIDALAASGVILQRHYTTPTCSPSRAAFMTSRYPPRIGMDYMPLDFASKAALPLRFEVLPQWLKRLGYRTHMIGKV
ncbi:hypothetical protein MTO96_013704, partial [Rhipicephalus appendiculatus]